MGKGNIITGICKYVEYEAPKNLLTYSVIYPSLLFKPSLTDSESKIPLTTNSFS